MTKKTTHKSRQEQRLFGLIGFPLEQSFSKKYFDKKFKDENLDFRFQNFPLVSLDALPKLIEEHPTLSGLAVTIPHKKAVLKLLNSTPGIPDELEACNCIRIESEQLEGYNTDYIGFEKSLAPLLKKGHTKALVLGQGGAAEAVCFVLRKKNIPFNIVSRKLHGDAVLTYADLNQQIITEHLLIINTTPLGMFPEINEYPDLPYQHITKKHILYDLVYNPGVTIFLQKGKAQGAVIKNGLDMLQYQAEENWKIWNL